jgi:hypothetical protein
LEKTFGTMEKVEFSNVFFSYLNHLESTYHFFS